MAWQLLRPIACWKADCFAGAFGKGVVLKDCVQNEENSNPVDYGKLSDSIISIVNFHKDMNPSNMLLRLEEVHNGNNELLARYRNLLDHQLENVFNQASPLYSDALRLEIVESVLKTVIGISEKEFGFISVGDVETVIELPKSAPERWKDRNKKIRTENVVSFIKRVYGALFDNGFTREYLKKVDPEAYSALSTWISRNINDEELLAEAGFDLNLRKKYYNTNDDLKVIGSPAIREVFKTYSAAANRLTKKGYDVTSLNSTHDIAAE